MRSPDRAKGGGFALVRCELQDDGEANPASLFSALGALPTRGAYATAVACARARELPQ